MIIQFDSRICFFVESMINSMIDRFVDVLKMRKNDSFRFFLNSNNKRNTINDFIET
jgi:hypothetical protein